MLIIELKLEVLRELVSSRQIRKNIMKVTRINGTKVY